MIVFALCGAGISRIAPQRPRQERRRRHRGGWLGQRGVRRFQPHLL